MWSRVSCVVRGRNWSYGQLTELIKDINDIRQEIRRIPTRNSANDDYDDDNVVVELLLVKQDPPLSWARSWIFYLIDTPPTNDECRKMFAISCCKSISAGLRIE